MPWPQGTAMVIREIVSYQVSVAGRARAMMEDVQGSGGGRCHLSRMLGYTVIVTTGSLIIVHTHTHMSPGQTQM